MDVLLTKAVETLVLPPGFNIVAVLVGLYLLRRWRKCAVLLILNASLSLYVLSLPWLARTLVGSLETHPPLSIETLESSSPGAIVVLGAGIYPDAPEYGEDTLSSSALPRLRYGAYLHRRTGLPVLVTGGRVFGEGVSEGELMKVFLETELGVEVAHVETASLNTAENAQYARQILEPLGVGHVVVVTHASHMARAVASFEREGFAVLPAPIEYLGPSLGRPGLLGWLPNLSALGATTSSPREYLGRAWYAIRY